MFSPGVVRLFGEWAGPLAVWLASTVLLIAILKTRSANRGKICN
jgi:hypothetical protein